MDSGGYGIYSGIGGLPYAVGGAANFGSPTGQQSVGAPQGSPVARPTQEQQSPGAYGSDIYSSLMPQWMQDYFDANSTGQGSHSLDTARELLVQRYPELIQKYGQSAAMNPYFTKQSGAQKGFDPFKNPYYTTNVESGRFQEYNPWFTYNKTTTQKRDPFSGDVQDTQVKYDQTYGDGGQAGYEGSDVFGMNPYQLGAMALAPTVYGPYVAAKKAAPTVAKIGRKLR